MHGWSLIKTLGVGWLLLALLLPGRMAQAQSGAVRGSTRVPPTASAVAITTVADTPGSLGVTLQATMDKGDPQRGGLVWDFGDGVREQGAGSRVHHTYAVPGTYMATVMVPSVAGRMAKGWVTVTVGTAEPPPPLELTVYAQPGVNADPLGVAFLVGVIGADAETVAVQWDFGDGAQDTESGVLAYHVYAASGTYTATVTVQAPDGRATSGTISVTVDDTVETPPAPPLELELYAQPGVLDDPLGVAFLVGVLGADAETVAVTWDFGDGAQDSNSGVLAYHVYAASGTYTATVTVQAPDGRATSGTISVLVDDTVETPPAPPLELELYAQPGVTDDPRGVAFYVGVLGADAETVAVTWDFGDGAQDTESGVLAYHVYAASGTYTATVTVQAPDGRATSGTISVTVDDMAAPPPVPPLELELYAQPGVTDDPLGVAFLAGVTGADAESLAVTWDFGDGTQDTESGALAYHVYAASGTYTATVTVQAPDGRAATGTITVTVDAAGTAAGGGWSQAVQAAPVLVPGVIASPQAIRRSLAQTEAIAAQTAAPTHSRCRRSTACVER